MDSRLRAGLGAQILGTLAIAAATIATSIEGYARQSSAPSQPYGMILSGDGDLFGMSIASCGDLDHDGVADILVGSPLGPSNSVHPGAVEVFSGADGKRLMVCTGIACGVGFGRCVAGLGDLDGDGVPDFVGGASPLGGGEAYRYVEARSGANGRSLWRFPPTMSDDCDGSWVARVGDSNGDGVDDVAVRTRTGASGFGIVIVSGRDGKILRTIGGPRGALRLARGIRVLPDQDGDGVSDFLVVDLAGPIGTPKIVSGWSGSLIAATPIRLIEHGAGAEACVLDLDSRGRVQRAVFASFDNAVDCPGRVDVVPFGDSRSPMFVAHPGQFGWQIESIRDQDGDGVRDLVVVDMTFLGERICLLSGRDLSEITRLRAPPRQPDAHSGYTLANVGDLDRDGYDEIALGAVTPDSPSDRGFVYILNTHTGELVRTLTGS